MKPFILAAFPIIMAIKTISADSKCMAEAGMIHIDYCCNTSLDSCIRMKNSCEIARKLDLFSHWLDTINCAKPCSLVIDEIRKRYHTLTDTQTCKIDLKTVTLTGSPSSKITIIMYISATCPLCKRIYKDMYESANFALLAAAHFGKQSELMLSLYDIKERISIEQILKKSVEIGIPSDSMSLYMNSNSVKAQAQASASESSVNGVKYSPAFFINGRPYHSYKDPQWVIDAVQFEYNKLVR
jgi:glutaredoxin